MSMVAQVNEVTQGSYQLFDALTDDEYKALKDDIRERGVLVPVELDENDVILDGHHRVKAWNELRAEGVDITPYPRAIRPGLTDEQKRNHTRALNFLRRHLTKEKRAEVFAAMRADGMTLQDIADAAGVNASTVQRTLENSTFANAKVDTPTHIPGKDGKARPVRYTPRKPKVGTSVIFTTDEKKVHTNALPEAVMECVRKWSITEAWKIEDLTARFKRAVDDTHTFWSIYNTGYMQSGEEVDALYYPTATPAEIKKADQAESDAHKQFNRDEKRNHAQRPEGAYNVIYADPPWEYDNAIKQGGPASLHYDTMKLEDICTLPHDIGMQVDKNAVLFMWVTNPFLQDAFRVVESWGFTYKTNIVWVKTNLVKPGSGFYVRGRHELLFICTRGSFTPIDEKISPPIGSVLEAPIREHSRKPDEVYTLIERLYPRCRYLELFARQQREGWTAYGDEISE